nr:titin homolog [Ipomoea batatas]
MENDDGIALLMYKHERGGNVESNLGKELFHEPEIEDEESRRKQRGKGNVEKWLHMLLESTDGTADVEKLDLNYPPEPYLMLEFFLGVILASELLRRRGFSSSSPSEKYSSPFQIRGLRL